MSKREAQGPQGDKDSLREFSMATTPDEKPQRATAAQMANRKIKDARRRRPASSAPSLGSPQPSTPFSSIDPNIVSSNSATPQPPTNGFAFGQSQSFPGAEPDPSQSSQGSTPFSFGAPQNSSQPSQGSTPFAFGAASGSSSFDFSSGPAPSNPFANMGAGTPNQPQQSGNGFGGFQGSIFNIAPASPAQNQQPLPSTGLFGSNSNAAGAVTTTSGPSDSAKPSTPATFGSSSALKSTTPMGMFGQSTHKSPVFGQSPFGGSDTMHTSPDGQTPRFNFGTSTSFGSPASGASFGGTSNANSLFGTKPTAPSSGPAFGAPSPTKEAANPFQSTSLFATPSTSTATPKGPEEKKANNETTAPQPTPSTTAGPSLFSKSANAAPEAKSGGLFGAPAFGASQPAQNPFGSLFANKPASTPNLFAPKPSAPSTSPEKAQTSTASPAPSAPAAPTLFGAPSPAKEAANPFQSGNLFASSQQPKTPSLFAPKPSAVPATTERAQASAEPPADKVKENVQGVEPQTGNLFTPKPSAVPASTEQTQTSIEARADEAKENVQVVEPQTPNLFTPKPSAAPTTEKAHTSTEIAAENAQASTETSAAADQTKSTSGVTMPAGTTQAEMIKNFALGLKPRKIPPGMTEEQEEDYVILYQIRTLNQFLKREITKLDPAEDDFDRTVMFYSRVRRGLGLPLGFKKSKRKAPEGEPADVEEGPSQKRLKSSDESIGGNASSSTQAAQETAGATTASGMNIGPSSITSTPSKLFGVSQPTPSSHKRKSVDEGIDGSADEHRGKRTRDSTVSAFAESFFNSKSGDSATESASPVKPSTPSSSKPSGPSTSTTSASTPFKPLFQTSSATQGPSASSVFSQSALKLASGATTIGEGQSPAAKATEAKTAEPSPAPAFQIPKFGSASTGGTDFMSQFKKQADATTAEEKAKRKAEDFDSDEDDEAEWERKDAEEQRKKHQQLESLSKQRSKFVPGKGFVFEDDNEASEPKTAEPSTAPAFEIPKFGSATGGTDFMSQFQKQADATTAKDKAKRKADDFDSDEDDEAEWERKDAEEQRKKRQQIESLSKQRSKFVPGKGFVFEHADEAPESEKADQGSSISSSTGKSIFESQNTSLPKGNNIFGHLSATPSEGEDNDADDKTEPAESRSATPSSGRSLFDRVQAPNSFGQSSMPSPGGSLFASSSKSIFGASQGSNSGGDHTWKKTDPIKFGTSQDSGAATPKPFSALFGAKDDSADKAPSSTPKAGFSFGAPAPQSSSFLNTTPSFNTDGASRSTTPGTTSDGAEKSGDGEAAEALPQADLVRGGAGEENEDVLLEVKARGLVFKNKTWELQAVGVLRILKDRTTSRTRVLIRGDPGGNVLLNAFLMKEFEYRVSGGAVTFAVPLADGRPQQWAIRVKKEMLERLASTMEENKS